MKVILILLVVFCMNCFNVNDAAKLPIKNRVVRQQINGQVVPIISTSPLDEDLLEKLLNGNNQNNDQDDLFQLMSEESSGDFDLDNEWSARKIGVNDQVHPPDKHDNKKASEPSKSIQTIGKQDHAHFSFDKGWIHYKYEKAFILINKTATYEEADHICHSFNKNEDIGSELAVPQSDEEQVFLNHYMFNMSRSVKNVWIGQKTANYRNSSQGFNLFADWGKGMPTFARPCVQIRSPYTTYADMDGSIGGKWEDVSCNRRNLVLCQRPQHWSHHQFIRVLNELKKDMEEIKGQIGSTYLSLALSLLTLFPTIALDVIPLGFIYVQLPNQYEPNKLWPRYEWKEISPQYSGLFFRVIGDRSAQFGHIQESSSPRLSGFKSYGIHGVPGDDLKVHKIMANNMWSDSYEKTEYGFPVSFRVTDDEVIPRNTAIKVWKRI